MLRIMIGRAKTGKSNRVLQEIKEQSGTGKQILLVPEHASYQAEVDLCRVCGNAVSRHAEVLSFQRLFNRVMSRTGGLAAQTLDAGGKILTMQLTMMDLAPVLKVYRHPSQRTAFLRNMLDLFDEFRTYQVTPEQLMQQTERMEGATRDKLQDLSLLYSEFERRITSGNCDARDYVTRLSEKLEESGYVRDKDIFVDGFAYFTAKELLVLQIMMKQARSVTVVLMGDESGEEEIFQSAVRMKESLLRAAKEVSCKSEVIAVPSKEKDLSDLEHLERYFFGETQPYEGECSSIRVLEADTLYSEVEQAAAEIRRMVASGRCRYRDITVAARNMGDYEGYIEAVFQRYEIPVYMSRRTDILEKPLLSFLNSVLSSVCNGYEYEDMFQWLKSGLAGITADECDLLENYVLKWDIHGRMWLNDKEWIENPDGYGVPLNQEREDQLKTINQIRNRIRIPLSKLEEELKGLSLTAGKVNALYSFLEELDLLSQLEEQVLTMREAGRIQEAEETAQLWELLGKVLDQMERLIGDREVDLDLFVNLFRRVISEYSIGTIPVTLDQVSVSEITRNDRHTCEYLFLLGANDHVLPNPADHNGILNEDDREALALCGITLAPSGMDRMGLELQSLYAALAQGTSGLIVSYPVTDISGNELRPAFLVDRLCLLFPELRIEKEDGQKAYRLSAKIPALENAGQHPNGTLWQWFENRNTEKADSDYRMRLDAMERAGKIRRGSLSRSAVRSLYGDRISMSASRLERLRSCHFAYFMEYGLKARARTAATFDAPQIGTFLHYLLEHVTREVLSTGGFAVVADQELHALVRKYTERYVEEELRNFSEKSDRFRYLFNRLQRTAYSVVDQVADEMRHSDFIPLEFELSFGDRGTLPAVVISEPDAELRINGKVDRVDGWIKDDKLYLRVVDYKSGKKAFDLSAVKLGLDIQMLLYLFTLQKSGKEYFGKEIEPAGVLYLPARDEILSAERNIPAEKLDSERKKTLKRSGLLLSQPEVLRAMEHDALEKPQYLPVRVNKNGELSGSIASAAQLGKLGQYIETLLHQISDEVRQGNIDADPCCHNEDDRFCRFCDWADACHFQDGRDGDHLHYILPVKQEEFWALMDQESKRGGN